jgi:DNA-binding transcriptional LysR family regulator
MGTSLENLMNGLSVRHLRGFVTVAETGHFGRAAARLEITQPLLSQVILRLEQVVGAKLLHRRPAVRLTPTGVMFLPYAARALEEVSAGMAAATKSSAGVLGQLSLGFPTLLSLSWLPEAIAAYHRSFAEVQISYADLTTTSQLQALRSGLIDVAFIRQEESEGKDLHVLPIETEPLTLALSSGHPLAGRGELKPHDLRGEPFILFPRSTAPRLFDAIIGAARHAKLELNLVREARDWLTVLGLVRAGAGLSFVPASLAQLGLPGLSYCRVFGLNMETTLSIARLAGTHNPVVVPFVEAVKSFARDREGIGRAPAEA